MCKLGIYTVLTRKNVSGHYITISSSQKGVNLVFALF